MATGLYVQNTPVTNIYVGDTPVTGVYVGDTKIWPPYTVVYSDPAPASNVGAWSTANGSLVSADGNGLNISPAASGTLWSAELVVPINLAKDTVVVIESLNAVDAGTTGSLLYGYAADQDAYATLPWVLGPNTYNQTIVTAQYLSAQLHINVFGFLGTAPGTLFQLRSILVYQPD